MNRSSRLAIFLCLAGVTLAMAPQVRSHEACSGTRWLLDEGRAESLVHARVKPGLVDFNPAARTANEFETADANAIAPPLLRAAAAGDPAEITRLLDAGASVNARNLAGDHALAIVVRNSQFELARTLLARGADPNPRDSAGITALMRTVLDEIRYLAWLLLRHGAAPDLQDSSGHTPLIAAIRKGRDAAAEDERAGVGDHRRPSGRGRPDDPSRGESQSAGGVCVRGAAGQRVAAGQWRARKGRRLVDRFSAAGCHAAHQNPRGQGLPPATSIGVARTGAASETDFRTETDFRCRQRE